VACPSKGPARGTTVLRNHHDTKVKGTGGVGAEINALNRRYRAVGLLEKGRRQRLGESSCAALHRLCD
jgi:hypothetical protein